MQTNPNTTPRHCKWCNKPIKGRKRKKFCGTACYHQGRSPLGITRQPSPTEPRFWKFVKKSEGCWLWTGTLIVKGYGRFTLKTNKKVVAHRFAYEITHGPIPDGMQVCHDCDRFYPVGDITYRRCVRPDHLFLATNAENHADAKRKGRNAHGEHSGKARFTNAQILDMRQRYKAGNVTQRQLAKEYNTSQSWLSEILHGRRWAHLPV